MRKTPRPTQRSPEHGVLRNYVEWKVSLPWSTSTGKTVDVNYAAKILHPRLPGGVQLRPTSKGPICASRARPVLARPRWAAANDPVFMLDQVVNSGMNFTGILPRPCWRFSTLNGTSLSGTIISMSPSTCLKFCSSRPQINWTPFRMHCVTVWRLSSPKVTPKRKRSPSLAAIWFRGRLTKMAWVRMTSTSATKR